MFLLFSIVLSVRIKVMNEGDDTKSLLGVSMLGCDIVIANNE